MGAAARLDLGDGAARHDFAAALARHGLGRLRRGRLTTLQVNVGKHCNMACHHCHVDAGPTRTEVMPRRVAEHVVKLVRATPGIEVVDLTGGAPELNPNFCRLVEESRRLGRRVIDRCNLTVLFEPGQEALPEFLAAHDVEIVASLPCYQPENVAQQRGPGAFEKSIEALRLLNRLGYGRGDPRRALHLVYNPVGDFLPPPQARLEARYKDELRRHFGVEFDRLYTLTNMPIKRFAHWLERAGRHAAYLGLLVNHFNPSTVPELMCRSLVSVGWDGSLYDCDFNQMLEIPLGAGDGGGPRTVFDLASLEGLDQRPVATAAHCFGCTAGAGSSCSGALQ